MSNYNIRVAGEADYKYADGISFNIEDSAKARGTGIAKRSPGYIQSKMEDGKAIIATTKSGEFVGFCYIETFDNDTYISNSGLIVVPDHRKSGVAREIKAHAFKFSRKKFPEAKLFGLTTSLPVMRINNDLGYSPVPFSELTKDKQFWKGCESCVNFEILKNKEFKNCLCTGMLYDSSKKKKMGFLSRLRLAFGIDS